MNSSNVNYFTWVCDSTLAFKGTRGFFYGESPLSYTTSIILAQLSVPSLLSLFIKFILTPLGQSAFISMMLGGFLLGQSVWSNNSRFMEALFPLKSYYINGTFAFFGCTLFMFVVGAKMDFSMVRRSGKKAIVIGSLSFFVPLTLTLIVASILKHQMKMEQPLSKGIYYVAACQSGSSFHVIACLLADLKLLNSEIGRLALSASMISGTYTWVMVCVVLITRQGSISSQETLVWMFLGAGFLLILVVFVVRPIMIWMIQNTPEGKPIKESFVTYIFIMLLVCTFFGEVVGQHFILGPVILGMAVPDGPPLGSALTNKLESFISFILLPSYFVYSVSGVNIFSIHHRTVIIIGILAVTSFTGKLLAAMLPSLYCKMPPLDAFSLGLILSCQGITDVLIFQIAKLLFLLDEQMYSVMLIAMVFLTGAATPVIKVLYKPSMTSQSRKKRTIQHASPNAELRILACIYHQDYTPSIISLLEVSAPTANSPICCYVVHLIELTGRLSPLFIYHRPGRRNSLHATYSSHIINAFRLYEQHSNGNVIANLFTAISPFDTVHEEVFRLAVDKRTSMMIIPFHKQWTLHGIEEYCKARAVNRHILSNAPCSVGILIDRGTLGGPVSKGSSRHNIGVIFVQGNDDREALAYAVRMAEQPNVAVTLVHVIYPGQTSFNSLDKELDNDIISEFKIATNGKNHHIYKEEVVRDSVEMVNLIRSLENAYDLILVGRYHEIRSPIFVGFNVWCEFPELGFIGDMLASSDSRCEVSVLVVQQQTFGVEDKTDSFQYLMEEYSAVTVHTPRKSGKVWPIPKEQTEAAR